MISHRLMRDGDCEQYIMPTKNGEIYACAVTGGVGYISIHTVVELLGTGRTVAISTILAMPK